MQPARAIAVCAALLIGGAGCSSDARTQPTTADAAPAPVAPIDASPPVEPATPSDAGPTIRPRPRRRPKPETIQIILRSSPPGATASVDGVVVGTTPTFWQGEKTTTPREFTFIRRGYAMARYRFVPITGGVVHATLKPVISSDDAGPN